MPKAQLIRVNGGPRKQKYPLVYRRGCRHDRRLHKLNVGFVELKIWYIINDMIISAPVKEKSQSLDVKEVQFRVTSLPTNHGILFALLLWFSCLRSKVDSFDLFTHIIHGWCIAIVTALYNWHSKMGVSLNDISNSPGNKPQQTVTNVNNSYDDMDEKRTSPCMHRGGWGPRQACDIGCLWATQETK